jgi:hypothetical protein
VDDERRPPAEKNSYAMDEAASETRPGLREGVVSRYVVSPGGGDLGQGASLEYEVRMRPCEDGGRGGRVVRCESRDPITVLWREINRGI